MRGETTNVADGVALLEVVEVGVIVEMKAVLMLELEGPDEALGSNDDEVADALETPLPEDVVELVIAEEDATEEAGGTLLADDALVEDLVDAGRDELELGFLRES